MEAMAAPIKLGKLEAWESWCAEMSGPRKVEFEDLNQRYGLTTHGAWLQANPDGSNFAILVLDGPGASSFVGKMAASEHEFDVWFRSILEDVHPMDLSAPPPPAERRL